MFGVQTELTVFQKTKLMQDELEFLKEEFCRSEIWTTKSNLNRQQEFC